MSAGSQIANWDGRDLGGDLIGLSVSRRGREGLHLEAVGERGECLLGESQLDSLVQVHRDARIVVPDVGKFWDVVPEHRTVLIDLADQNRLYDFKSLADLVNLAEP